MVKNKGYTLIELIIVMAIIAILAGASFISIGIIRQAKRQAAVNTLDNQISSCLVRTKAVSEASNVSAEPLCMVIKKRSDGAYVVMTGTIDSSGNINLGGRSADTDADCEAILPKDIQQIVYHGTQGTDGNDDNLPIQFLKSDSSTQYGGGKYEIYVKGGQLYATICLDQVSGNHYIE